MLDARNVILFHHVSGEGNPAAFGRMPNHSRDEVVGGIVTAPLPDDWAAVGRHRYDDVPRRTPSGREEELLTAIRHGQLLRQQQRR